LTAVAVAIGIAISMHWATLSKVATSAAETMVELQGVQAAILRQYGPAQVFVKAKRHSGVAGTILSVQIVNSPALSALSGETARVKALEIATVSREALPKRDSYQHFEVIFGKQVIVGLKLNANQAFLFAAAELPPPTAATPEAPGARSRP
jgi:hypothetical protein